MVLSSLGATQQLVDVVLFAVVVLPSMTGDYRGDAGDDRRENDRDGGDDGDLETVAGARRGCYTRTEMAEEDLMHAIRRFVS
jgi:hypothetical protein